MKTLEQFKKKELIIKAKPNSDCYDKFRKRLGIENNILTFVKNLDIQNVINQRELLIDFSMKRNKAPKEFRHQYENEVDEYLKSINSL